jgi:hypothetical protein
MPMVFFFLISRSFRKLLAISTNSFSFFPPAARLREGCARLMQTPAVSGLLLSWYLASLRQHFQQAVVPSFWSDLDESLARAVSNLRRNTARIDTAVTFLEEATAAAGLCRLAKEEMEEENGRKRREGKTNGITKE